MRGSCTRYAGCSEILSGSVKILKQVLISFLAVREGSNVSSSPFATTARLFFSRRWCVRERLSLMGRVSRSNLGSRWPRMFLARLAHLCGFVQFRPLSWMQCL